jgi:hypothetical protein
VPRGEIGELVRPESRPSLLFRDICRGDRRTTTLHVTLRSQVSLDLTSLGGLVSSLPWRSFLPDSTFRYAGSERSPRQQVSASGGQRAHGLAVEFHGHSAL